MVLMDNKNKKNLISINLCKRVMIGATAMFIAGTSNAQTEPNTERTFPAHVGIYYPIGTHGRQSTDYTYNFALNVAYGRIGGLNGIGISGGVGRVEGNVKGIQISGLVSGAYNLNGIQVGGLVNGAGSVRGFQIGGGFVNGAENVRGMQIGGGFVNGAENVHGIQIGGGFVNGAENVHGMQIGGGFVNGAENVHGIQIGGIVNGAANMTGIQISGILNRSTTLRGIQIGLVSVNDTIKSGFSLSLVNIVRRGFYREWEASVSDYSNIAISYRMGMQRFYTIYTVGANFIEDNLWNIGIGFGNRTPIGSNMDFRPELVAYNYFPMNFKNIQNTFAAHLKFGFVYNISEKIGLSLAPNVYVMNSRRKHDTEHYKLSPVGSFYTNEKNNRRTTMGIGVSLGLSLR